MSSAIYPQNNPFHPITGELMPDYRDAYVQDQLTPAVAQQVEQYLGKSSSQTSLTLARYHELSAAAQLKGRTVTAPRWVQQQLLVPPLVAGAAPLRRPVVRVALLFFVALSVASGVQWVRNEPLVPAPVVAAVSRAGVSIAKATSSLARRFTAPQESAAPVSAIARPVRARAQAETKATAPRAARPVAAEIPNRPAALVAVVTPTDSVGRALPATLQPPAGAPSAPTVAPAAVAGTVRGYIRDGQGRPLVGATVLRKGTPRGTSTDATGQYVLEVPAGSVLQFGFGGYADLLRSATLGSMDVVLQPSTTAQQRAAR